MITLVKVNILTDDEAVPSELREKLTDYLRTLISDDPEGADNARVSLEWKHTVHNRDYMATLPATAHVERITVPAPKKEKARHEAVERPSNRRSATPEPLERPRAARVGRQSPSQRG